MAEWKDSPLHYGGQLSELKLKTFFVKVWNIKHPYNKETFKCQVYCAGYPHQ
jgi:hypothetical protein